MELQVGNVQCLAGLTYRHDLGVARLEVSCRHGQVRVRIAANVQAEFHGAVVAKLVASTVLQKTLPSMKHV